MSTDSSQLKSRWGWTRLDRVARVSARIGWKALTADEYQEDGFAFLATPNIKSAKIDFTNVNYISEFRYLESPELKLQLGDVLLAKDGNTLGITNVVTELPRPATVNGSIAVIRPYNFDSRYLRYALDSQPIQDRIQAFKDGMGVPHLFQRDINRFPLQNPPHSVQRLIADYLDAETTRIDALITKKRHLRASLMERAWNRIRAAVTTGLSTALETVEIQWLGPVRLEWRRPHLGAISSIYSGTSFPSEYQGSSSGDLPFAKVADLGTQKASPLEHVENWITRELAGYLGARIAPTGSVVYARVGAAMLLNPRKILVQPTILDDNVRGISFDRGDARYWAYLLCLLDLGQLANPGPVPSVSEAQVKEVRVPCPPTQEQGAIADYADAQITQARSLADAIDRQVGLLIEHRQALVTTAVTGELEIPGAS